MPYMARFENSKGTSYELEKKTYNNHKPNQTIL